MAKLTVKNVGPIREAEFEVKKHTVFIGPQGSGKSTLAKLIAIGGDYELLPFAPSKLENKILEKYSLSSYLSSESFFEITEEKHSVLYDKGNLNSTNLHQDFDETLVDEYTNSGVHQMEKDIENLMNSYNINSDKNQIAEIISKLNNMKQSQSDSAFKQIITFNSNYMPAERSLFYTLSAAIWSLAYANINLPKSITSFARSYETARNHIKTLYISFLDVHYKNQQGIDKIITSGKYATDLSESASGYQSIIPLILVTEHQRRQSRRRFIIEEPELSLYPIAQKELVYALMSGLNPDIEYQDAEWVITTHSPYVLSSFNTLMLAYKVAQKSDELRAEVEKIIPGRCWINPDEFAAYYVDNGTVRSIISEKTGLIADNELDDVSEDLAGEQDQLFELSRSVPRA